MTDNGEIVIGGDSVDIPPGTYPGKCVAITTKESVAFGEFRAWDFELATGSVVGGATSMNTGSKSKAGKWIAALMGRKLTRGEAVNVIGKPCLVVVGLNKDDWPTVDDVLPPMATSPVAAVSVAPAASQGTPALAELP